MKKSNERSMKMSRSTDSLIKQQNSQILWKVLNKKSKSSENIVTSKSRNSLSSSNSKQSLSDTNFSLKKSLAKFNVDDMSLSHIYESLIRLKENPIHPFSFVNNIFEKTTTEDHVSLDRMKPTEIDIQLSTLTRRIQLNRSLLERTNERVKEVNFLVERNAMMASRELDYEDLTKTSGDNSTNSTTLLDANCPGIMELQRTINVTKDMLNYVKKICNDEIRLSDLPQQLRDHMNYDN